MATKYYTNYLSGLKILEYSPRTGEYKEVWSATCPESELAEGFYVRVNDDFYGVYASSAGPICFKNGERYPVADKGYRIELIRGKGENQFILYWKEQKQFEVTYPFPDPDLPPGWWSSTDEDDDFFLWLFNHYQQGDKFIKLYTVFDADEQD